jgi:RPA family protein
MSQSESDDEVNRREVAYRLFAAEFDDADYSYAESDEERAPNYVVTPTGARVNRLFVVGVLTEIEQVNDDVVRARVVDPTGAFVVYAGQYQPEALAALESAETPSFVAVTGKARTFQPDDADVVYTSIRPETVTEVDAATRDRWVVTTAEQTAGRVATMAAARERVERGDRLRDALTDAGVEPGLAAGIPLALDHYETSPAYLAAVRDLAVGAAEVVAGEAESAGSLDLAPSEGGDASLDFAADLDADEQPETEPADLAASEPDSDEDAEPAAEEPGTDTSPDPAAETPSPSEVAAEAEPDDEATEAEPVDETDTAEAPAATEPTAESGAESADTAGSDGEESAAADAEAAAGDGEMYELSEEEREEVKDEYGVDFSTGSEVPEPGEADIDAPGPDEGIAPEETAEASGGADDDSDDLGDFDAGDDEPFDPDDRQQDADEDDEDDLDDFTEDEYDESESDSEDEAAGSMDLDLEDYVVDLMADLDDGDGAPRDEVIATAADERDADEGDIEDAIQDALMSGRCYESGDDHLKAI